MKRFVIITGALATLVVLVWIAGWLYFAREVHLGLVALADGDPSIACDHQSVEGFPFRFDVTCTGATITSGDLTLSLPEWRATALVYRPTHILAFAKSPARLTDAFLGSEREIGWDKLEASLRLNGTRLERLSVVADRPRFDNALFENDRIATASNLELHLLDAPTADNGRGRMTLAAFVKVKDLSTSLPDLMPLDASLDAFVNAVPDDMALWQSPRFLADWQAAGGQIVINAIKAEASDTSLVGVTATGHLGLSDDAYPSGTLTVTSRGITDIATRLSPEFGGFLVGAEQADGSNRQVLQFAGGFVRAGIVPLMQFAPLF